MNATSLTLPAHAAKPRTRGLTIVLDNGLPPRYFQDLVDGAKSLIDVVKFGWGTSIVSDTLEQKIACLREWGIDYYFGGTLFEKVVSQGQVGGYLDYCRRYGCQYSEIPNATVAPSNPEKAGPVQRVAPQSR